MKPNLFIVGAPKCGTTAWSTYLGNHPSVGFARLKEPHHFCTDFPGFCFFPERDDYEELFAGLEGFPILGEASVMYLYSRVAARNIYEYNKNARILILVRRQEDYLPSFHNQLLFNGIECLSDFETAWSMSGHRSPDNTPPYCREPQFLDYRSAGRFHEQVERFYRHFPAQQIRIFHFDDWSGDPRWMYLQIMDFLELQDDGRTDFPRVNAAAHHRSQRLGSFTQQPPPWAIKLSALVKRLTGRDRPPLVDRLRALNRAEGYAVKTLSPRLSDEIRSYYAADNALLEPRIWRPR